MAKGNVEVVRKAFEAWNDGDMQGLRALYHPEVIVRAPPGWPEPGPFVGRDAVMRQFEQLRSTFATDTARALSDFLAVADRVVVRVDWQGVGHGPESHVEMTLVYTLRDGLVHHLEYFWNHDEVLRTVGLA